MRFLAGGGPPDGWSSLPLFVPRAGGRETEIGSAFTLAPVLGSAGALYFFVEATVDTVDSRRDLVVLLDEARRVEPGMA